MHPSVTASAFTCRCTVHLLAVGAAIWLTFLPENARGINPVAVANRRAGLHLRSAADHDTRTRALLTAGIAATS